MQPVPFADLGQADLVVDRIYRGGVAGNRGDDPISKLLPVGNAGGFRFRGSPSRGDVKCLVLYTSSADPDWPDRLDVTSGTFTYYGDNKQPGRELHDTPRKGNLALSNYFDATHSKAHRTQIPPILLFAKAGTGADVVFRGLLVPGSPTVPADEQLVAIWRSAHGERFQNYRATFSVLDVRCVKREWLDQLCSGQTPETGAPSAWREWVNSGIPRRLMAPRSIEIRTREEQLPRTTADMNMIREIHRYFSGRPQEFEHCAAQLWMMLAPATDELVVTRQSRDGGRDAVGRYRLGPVGDPISIEFALEAKCYTPHNSVGVRDMSRLISRLKHRDFGVLVTTSYVHPQAYREIREDGHPIAIVCASDIVEILKRRGWGNVSAVCSWLDTNFQPYSSRRFTGDLTAAPPRRIAYSPTTATDLLR
ncbi:restriction endonuclease [Intrasporangium flavum]|uniref:restriction endonuclease n=1 Tax=Intrasporangium flavum TaxID=1428657 RepID=UPI0009F94C28